MCAAVICSYMFVMPHTAKAVKVDPTILMDVHSLWWKATLKSDKTVRNEAGEKVKFPKGSKVIVTSRPNTGKNCRCMKDGISFSMAKAGLNFVTDACTIKEGDYNVLTKEHFVNVKHHISSPTDYLIWASLDKQRVNIFQKDETTGEWKLIRVSKCSSGYAYAPTKIGFNMDVSFKKRVYSYSNPTFHATVEYFCEFSGSGFHKYAGGGKAKNLGKHPVSHSCIRLPKKHAVWMFENIPVKTRVIIY